jgi:hypothetical protein
MQTITNFILDAARFKEEFEACQKHNILLDKGEKPQPRPALKEVRKQKLKKRLLPLFHLMLLYLRKRNDL